MRRAALRDGVRKAGSLLIFKTRSTNGTVIKEVLR